MTSIMYPIIPVLFLLALTSGYPTIPEEVIPPEDVIPEELAPDINKRQDAVIPETDLDDTERNAAPPCEKVLQYMYHAVAQGQKGLETINCKDGPHFYDITVPAHCTTSHKCGLIVNTHGYSMTSQSMRDASGIAKAALLGKKFVVITPEDANRNWEFRATGQTNDAGLIAKLVKKAMRVFKDILDPNHVNAAGFSQGAMMSFALLCQESRVFCSAAPIGFSPQGEFLNILHGGGYVSGLPTCWNPAMGGKGPAKKRSVMFHLGTKDIFFQREASNAFENGVNAIKQLYSIEDKGTKLDVGAGAKSTQYRAPGGQILEAVSYDFEQTLKTPVGVLHGHCIPFKGQTQGSSASFAEMGFRCGPDKAGDVAQFSWGDRAIAFFESHGCDENKIFGWTCHPKKFATGGSTLGVVESGGYAAYTDCRNYGFPSMKSCQDRCAGISNCAHASFDPAQSHCGKTGYCYLNDASHRITADWSSTGTMCDKPS